MVQRGYWTSKKVLPSPGITIFLQSFNEGTSVLFIQGRLGHWS